MQSISNSIQLRDAILELQQKQAEQGQMLKVQFQNTLENLKPANQIRSIISEVKSSPDILGTILNVAVSLTAGYFSKSMIVGASGSIVKKILGSIMQLGVPIIMAKKPGAVKLLGERLKHGLFRKKETIS